MGKITLKINIARSSKVTKQEFDSQMTIFDVCRQIREKVPDSIEPGESVNDYGLLKLDELDPRFGTWLESARNLEFYQLENNAVLDYRTKKRPLRVETLDMTIRTVIVDDSLNVKDLVKTVCARYGLNNPEEFSFIVKDEEGKFNKERPSMRNAKKMAQMKKNLHTDDELKWLSSDKSLRDQGVDEKEVVVLRKRYYFTDKNVDGNDPIQLGLLYVQSQKDIVEGTHPCTKDEAVKFAALQLQIMSGDYDEEKHKPANIIKNLSFTLPKEYSKARTIERLIAQEWKHYYGLKEMDAKFRFIQLCRALKTYGVTFFLVKEKMKARNRLVPRLLGITRDSIMRVDEITKDVMTTWPLTTVKRWAASPNSFTLDFGDYHDSFYSVQTSEGETISQLIAGYIDIILKKKKASEKFIHDVDDEVTMIEDNIAPRHATQMQLIEQARHDVDQRMLPNVGVTGLARIGADPTRGHMDGAQHSQMGSVAGHGHMAPGGSDPGALTQAQQALIANIDRAIDKLAQVSDSLKTASDLPALGRDSASIIWKQNTMDVSKQNVNSQLAAMLAATSSVLTMTREVSEIDYTAVGSAVTTITSNLTELSKSGRMIAALLANEGQDGANLLKAAQDLSSATGKFLQQARPPFTGHHKPLLDTAGDVGNRGGNLLKHVGESEVDPSTQERIISLAKQVGTSTTELIGQAKNVATKCDDPSLTALVVQGAKDTASATQQLVTCTKVLVPCIDSPLCQEQLIEACKAVAYTVDKLVELAQKGCTQDEAALGSLGKSAGNVSTALKELIDYISQGMGQGGGQYDEVCEAILAAHDNFFSSVGNPGQMVKQAQGLAQATSELIKALQTDASKQSDASASQRLLDAAKQLAAATAKMVSAGSDSARNLKDPNAQEALKKAAEDLRSITTTVASQAIKRKVIRKLEVAAKQTAAVCTQCIAAAQGAEATNRNTASQQQLISNCKVVADNIARLVQAVKTTMSNPDSPSAQLGLINASQSMLQPAGKMVAAAKAAVPTIGDQAAAMQLGNFAKSTAAAIHDLRIAVGKAAEACGSLEIDSALDVVRGLGKDLVEAQKIASAGKLLPLPGESAKECAEELGATSKTVGASMAQLLTAANQGNESYTGIASRDTANALRVLASSVRGVAAGTMDKQHQDEILYAAKNVMDQSVVLIVESKAAVDNPNMPNKQSKLAQAARGVSQALNQVVSCLPGPKHVDQALKDIARASQQIDPKNSIFGQKQDQSYQTLQNNLSQAAANLNAAASQLVASSKGSSEELAASATLISKRYEELLISGLQLASCSSDAESQQEMLGYLKTISISSTKLLLAAKALAADPNAPNAKNQLAAAARLVTDSINTLINVCTSSAPGQKECDTALRNIQMVASVLDDPKEPVNDASFFECLDTVLEKSAILNEAVSDISTSTREGNHEKFCDSIRSVSSCVTALAEYSAHAAYLVGVSDPRSDPAVPGLVDQGQFARAQHSISLACQTLLNPACSQQQVLASATTIAKHTSQLCTVCKSASNNTTNPVAKKHFMNSAKDVANSTGNLVKKIKDLSSNLTPENREACSQSTKPLLEAVEALATFASSAEFASVPARISPQAHDAMTPILMSGKNMVSNSNSLISTSKTLVLHPDDQNLWQLLAQHSKSLTDSIRGLVNAIRSNSPGQKECQKAAGVLNRAIGDIDRATLEGMQQNLPPRQEHSLAGFRDQLLNTIEEISQLIDPVTVAANGETENLGHSVTNLTSHFTSFTNFAIGMASRVSSSADQQAILEQSKTLTEAALQLITEAKEAGGKKSVKGAHSEIDQSGDSMQLAIRELILTVQKPSDPYYNATDNIYKAVDKLDVGIHGELEDDDFIRCQDEIFQGAKAVAKLAQESLGKTGGDQSEMIRIVTELSTTYTNMSDSSRKAIRLAETEEVSLRIKRSVAKLGSECIEFVKNASIYTNLPNDAQARKSHTKSVKGVIEKVNLVMTALQAGSKGTQACINAISVIQAVVGDLETTVMFANARTLNPESKESFSKHKEGLLGSCQKLVEETKRLVSSVQATQDELSKTAVSCETHVQQLAENAKLAAAALTEDDPEAQVLLLNAVKDVAIAMGTLLEATKNASGRSRTDSQMLKLKDAAKSMVTSVTSLMKTITSVEDEAGRSQRALETAIEAINQSMIEYESRAPSNKRGSPEEMLNCSKELTKATARTARAVLPGSQKQEELTAAANDGRNAVTSLLPIVKYVAQDIENAELKLRCQQSGRDAAVHYTALLEFVKTGTGKRDSQMMLRTLSHDVAHSISELVQVAEAVKEYLGYAHPDNPAVLAERELLLAAAAIDMAAKKLAEARPIARDLPELSGDMKFEEAILHAAKAIARATRALVQAATDAQHELVKQGRMKSGYGDENSIWSEGLVSAAKQVARSTSELCESANACVTSTVPESQDRLVASAKSIAKHTAQLLMACRVKADPNSETNLRLRRAGLSVKKATDSLVEAALEAKLTMGDASDPDNPHGDRDAFKKELEMMSEIAKKERELEAARSALQNIKHYRKDIKPQY